MRFLILATLVAVPALAQQYPSNVTNAIPAMPRIEPIPRVTTANEGPAIIDTDGTYRGRLSTNPYARDSIANPYGRYGSEYSPDSINNVYGPGNPYRLDSPNNTLGTGSTEGPDVYLSPEGKVIIRQ